MKSTYRIVKYYSHPYLKYRFKIQEKELWWWFDAYFGRLLVPEFNTASEAEDFLWGCLREEEEERVVKIIKVKKK